MDEAFLGFPLAFEDICFIYPPLNKDIVKIGYDKFTMQSSLLTRSQEDIDDEMEGSGFDSPTPFIYLMTLCKFVPQINDIIKEGIAFFTHENASFLYDINSIVIGDIIEKRIINEENFFDFQNLIRVAVGNKQEEKPNPNENPRIKQFKALARKRDRVKAKQQGNDIKQFSTLLTSACCMNIGLNPSNIGDITFAAMNALMARYAKKDEYETRMAVSIAGGSSEDNSFWIKDL